MTILETSVAQAASSEQLDSKKAKEIRKRIALFSEKWSNDTTKAIARRLESNYHFIAA